MLRTARLRRRWLLAVIALCVWATGPQPAQSTTFLQLDGIEGGVQIKQFEGWSQVQTFSFSISREPCMIRCSGALNVAPISTRVVIDRGSPQVFADVTSGKLIPSAEIVVTEAGAGGQLQPQQSWEFQRIEAIGFEQVNPTTAIYQFFPRGTGEFCVYDAEAKHCAAYDFRDARAVAAVEPELGFDGDFDGSGELSLADVILLQEALRENSPHLTYDVDKNGTVDQSDLHTWVKQQKQTWFGDANLDGVFDSSDLVQVFAAGEYQDDLSLNSTWATGDWNGDSEFNTADLVRAFEDGGYRQGPRMATNAVPEPASAVLFLGGLIGVALRHRRYR